MVLKNFILFLQLYTINIKPVSMKPDYLFIIISLLFFSFIGCNKKTTITGTNFDNPPKNIPLLENTGQEMRIIQKFNLLPLKEKIKLYNKMIADSQLPILNFFKEKGMSLFLKKFVTSGASWTKDIEKFINIEENNVALQDNLLFIGSIPLYGISEQKHGSTDAEIQYVNFFPNNFITKSDVRFITFYAWQEDNIDVLEIKNIDNSSLSIYFRFKNKEGATIQVQANSGLSQHTVESPFVFDNTLFPNINEAIKKMITSIR